jgi:hypothetical protein
MDGVAVLPGLTAQRGLGTKEAGAIPFAPPHD